MLIILVIFLFFKGKKASDYSFVVIRAWAFLVTNLSIFVYYKILDKEKAPVGKPYVYVLNHSSWLDAVALVYCIRPSFKPLGKIEMVKVPGFGAIYKRLVVMIDRKSKESREKCVAILRDELAEGMSIVILPEGTMNRTDHPLNNFYDGAFRIAIETQTPIAPICILNARYLFPRENPLALKPGTVTCQYLDVVETKGMTLDDLPQLKEKVHSAMFAVIRDFNRKRDLK